MASIRILSEEDVRAVIDTERALELARRTLLDQAAGRSYLSSPPVMTLDASAYGSGRFKFKAANVGHVGYAGIRLISRRSAIDTSACNYTALYQHGGLELSGLVPELWTSRIRTAAFGAALIEHLCRPGPLVVALFGTGRISTEIVPMLASTLTISELRVTSQRAESMASFAAAFAPRMPFPIRIESQPSRAVDGADLVITLTDAASPLVLAGQLKPGAVVCTMGGKNEVDYAVLAEGARLVVDDPDFASEVGDGGAWIRQGHLTREKFLGRIDALACEVASGSRPARISRDDRIIAIVQGMAIGDVAFSAFALHEAERVGRGKVVDLP
jgi:ornithine cyclodeaminase/alanine dehydrogenase-like protein (mu-crystallin family)